MKLHNIDNSPFAARVRMQIRHKALSVQVCDPVFALRSPEFKSAYPLGKVPVLELGDGTSIGESTAIMNYLEREFPQLPMRPADSLAQAQDDMLIRYVDNHLALGLSPVFQEFFKVVHARKDIEANDQRFDLLMPELDKLERLLGALPNFVDRDLQLGDLCLASNLYYVSELTRFFAKDDVFTGFVNITAWQSWVQQFEAVVYEVDVMDVAHRAMLASLAQTDSAKV